MKKKNRKPSKDTKRCKTRWNGVTKEINIKGKSNIKENSKLLSNETKLK